MGEIERKDRGTVARECMTFAELEASEMEVSAKICREWLENRSAEENLLMVWGTDSKYLLKFKYAVENWMKAHGTDFQTYSVEAWINQMLAALNVEKPEYFYAQMMEPEGLIIEHVDCLSGKTHTQAELFQMIKKRNDCGKVTILFGFSGSDSGLHADSYFKEINGNLEQYLEKGMVVQLGKDSPRFFSDEERIQ